MTGAALLTAPTVRPVCQVAIGDTDIAVGQAVYDTARYNEGPDATYAGLEALFADLSCTVIEASTFVGRERSHEAFEVGTATLTVANDDGTWDYPAPDGVERVLTLRPGRQLRVGVAVGADVPGHWTPDVPYVPGYLDCTVGYVTAADAAEFTYSGDVVLVARITTGTTGTTRTLVGQYGTTTGGQAWRWYRHSGGAINANVRTAAPETSIFYAPNTAAEIAALGGGVVDIAFANRPSDGANSQMATLRSSDGGATWAAYGTASTPQAAFASVKAVTTALTVGAISNGTSPWNGHIHSIEMRSGLDPKAGTVLWRFDADDYPGGAATSYTDPRGRTWTLSNAAAIIPKVPAVPPVWVPAVTAEPQWLWRGWIDATASEYLPGVGDVVAVDCIDAKGEAGRTELGALVTAVGAAETATDRVRRIANAAAFPSHRRAFDESDVKLQATTMGGRAGGLFDLAADSSGGAVFGDANGYIVYRSRDWLEWPTGTPADVTIGNRPGDEACPNAWEVAFNRADFASRVVYGRNGEDPRHIDDLVNQARYGVETFTQTGLETNTLQDLDNIGQRLARARSFNRAPRVAACTLDAARDGCIGVMVSVSPFTPTLAYIGLVEDDGRTVFSRYVYVTGVEHTITAEAWTARIALDDAYPYLTQSAAAYDTARYNQDHYARVV